MNFTHKTQLLYTYKAGPYASRRWHKTMQALVDDLTQRLDPEDSFLLQLWPRICRERGAARAQVIRTMPTAKLHLTMGEMVAWSRWFSWHKRERQHREFWSTEAIPLVLYGLVEGLV